MRSRVRVFAQLNRLSQHRVLDVDRLISALPTRVLSTCLLRAGLVRVTHIGHKRVGDAYLVEGEFVLWFVDAVEYADLHVLEALIELVFLHCFEFGVMTARESERHLLVGRMANLLVNYLLHFLCSQELRVLE